MAKAYKRGADYILYYNSGSYASPTWNIIKACGDVGVNPDTADIEVPERGMDTGHLGGENNPSFTFTLYEDTGDANVVAMITAIHAKQMKELAVADGPIATSGTKYFRMECLLLAPLAANRPDPASYDVTAVRHANSDYNMTRNTV